MTVDLTAHVPDTREQVSLRAGASRVSSATLSTLAMALLTLLAALQLLIWVKAIEGRGGLDAYARHIDFAATLTGALIVHDGDGARLYDLDTQRAAQERVLAPYITPKAESVLPYIHPPFEALLVAPLVGLSYGLLYALWSGLIVLALAASLVLLARTLPVAGSARWVLLAAIGSYGALYQVLWLGQSSPLVLLGLCGTYAGIKRRRDSWAGAALALMALKPQMLLVIALLLLMWRRWRALAVCGGILAGLSVAAMPVLGLLWPLHYARFLAGIPTWGGSHHEYPAIMHNWRGLAFNLLGEALPWSQGPIVAGLTIGALLGLVWAWWHSSNGEGTDCDLLWAAGCVVAILIAPHLYLHDLTLLIFPAWIVVAQRATRVWRASLAHLWLGLLWSVHLLAILFLLIADSRPALPVVPTIVLIAVAGGLLILRGSNLGVVARDCAARPPPSVPGE